MEQVGTLRHQFLKLDLPVDLLPAQYTGTPVAINRRLSRALGRVCWRRSPFDAVAPYVATIELQPWVMDGDLQIAREIVAHEAAHVVCGPGVGHRFPWGQWCRKLGGTGEPTINTNRVKTFLPIKDTAICLKCQKEINLQRKLKRNRIYRHVTCGGFLLQRNPE